MADKETWPGEADFKAQLDLQRRFPGWTVSRYQSDAIRRGVEVPAGAYSAVHWWLSEEPLVAPDLTTLATAIQARDHERDREHLWADRSSLQWLEHGLDDDPPT